ncbi:hypothetical protein SODALDRAFT_130927 [Sodiomyces alkalinus F11]|uniref:Uncharacterized protein n=1 Tax=Sodiomyces alkalinus (strain CBS 110278 / VKM F-3762 / F11) TaxID=1314773 RepID=A0A3N2PYC4_SODAK|nr:hypothetical protein SODALDRAFT_130927 [Sodiomyces alkalinus F11]ROT39484.1 hypothetical protein SODALDRAFT_130927 [Sodiomyces alkalinus F11]
MPACASRSHMLPRLPRRDDVQEPGWRCPFFHPLPLRSASFPSQEAGGKNGRGLNGDSQYGCGYATREQTLRRSWGARFFLADNMPSFSAVYWAGNVVAHAVLPQVLGRRLAALPPRSSTFFFFSLSFLCPLSHPRIQTKRPGGKGATKLSLEQNKKKETGSWRDRLWLDPVEGPFILTWSYHLQVQVYYVHYMLMTDHRHARAMQMQDCGVQQAEPSLPPCPCPFPCPCPSLRPKSHHR